VPKKDGREDTIGQLKMMKPGLPKLQAGNPGVEHGVPQRPAARTESPPARLDRLQDEDFIEQNMEINTIKMVKSPSQKRAVNKNGLGRLPGSAPSR
jgi:hypothetical protein